MAQISRRTTYNAGDGVCVCCMEMSVVAGIAGRTNGTMLSGVYTSLQHQQGC